MEDSVWRYAHRQQGHGAPRVSKSRGTNAGSLLGWLSTRCNAIATVQGKVDGRTLDAKKLRRHVLRGAVVVFVTAGYSGKRFIFERCKELGIRSVILDASDSWSQQLVGEGIVEKFIGLDFSDSEALFGNLVEACKKVGSLWVFPGPPSA